MKSVCAIVLGAGLSVQATEVHDGKNYGEKRFDVTDKTTWHLYEAYAPGIAKIGTGYDILKSNPLSTTQADPGYLTRGIFALTFNQGLITPDSRRWHIPDNTNVDPVMDACSTSFLSSEMTGINNYVTNLGNQFSLSGFDQWNDARTCQGSQDYKDVDDRTTTNRTVLVHSLAQCESYSASMLINGGPPLSADFLGAVKNLPDVYDQELYYELVRQYGTHVVTGMRLGGRFGQQSTFNEIDYVDVIKVSSVGLASSYAATVAAGHSDTLTDAQVKEAHNFVTKTVDSRSWTVGGQYATTVDAWMATVSDSPMPVHLELTAIDKLFTEQYMPTAKYKGYAAKGPNVKKLLGSYCGLLSQFGEVKTCSALGTDRPVPTV